MKIGGLVLGTASIVSLLWQAVAIPFLDLGSKMEVGKPSKCDGKYFHEAGKDSLLGHYDRRFFRKIVSYDERRKTLHHMIRAYLNAFRERDIETWIAHGTLLGWWWNNKMLPWDWDLDVQVSGSTLEYLGKHLSGTIFHYVSEDKSEKRDYLLDVNPCSTERSRGDGQNIIDARWIDIQTGLFVDITGLSETHPDLIPGVWSCKNYHRYPTKNLFPMRNSTFEGVAVKIPYAYDQILIDEYDPKALLVTEYEGHRWDPQSKEWIKMEEPLLRAQHNVPQPHIPRSIQPRSTEPGLLNVGRLFQES